MPDATPPSPAEPHPLETELVNEWNGFNLAFQHLIGAINKVTEQWRQDRARIVELEARIKELEHAEQKQEAGGQRRR